MSRPNGARRPHFGREMQVYLVGLAMAGRPIGVGRHLAIDRVVDVFGESRRARIELEIERLVSAGFLRDLGPFLTTGAVFERLSHVN